MQKFIISALGTEALQAVEIEAETPEEAKELYLKMFDEGLIQALDYEIDHFTITDTETGKDIEIK